MCGPLAFPDSQNSKKPEKLKVPRLFPLQWGTVPMTSRHEQGRGMKTEDRVDFEAPGQADSGVCGSCRVAAVRASALMKHRRQGP